MYWMELFVYTCTNLVYLLLILMKVFSNNQIRGLSDDGEVVLLLDTVCRPHPYRHPLYGVDRPHFLGSTFGFK